MSKRIFLEKYINMLSPENFTQYTKCYQYFQKQHLFYSTDFPETIFDVNFQQIF